MNENENNSLINNNIGEKQMYNSNNNQIYNQNYNNSNLQGYNQNNNQNIDQDSTINQNIRQFENKVIMIVITIFVLILSIVGRLFSFGWLTVILMWTMLGPIHLTTFTMAGIRLSKIKNKSKKDYMYFAILCVSMLLYSCTFVDVGDSEANVLMKGIDTNILSVISQISLIINIYLIVVSIKRYNKYRKSENNITDNQNYSKVNSQENYQVSYQNQSSNVEKQKSKNMVIMRTITIILLVFSIVMNYSMNSFNIYTLINMPGFTIAGILLSKINNKRKIDYIYFGILCSSMALYSVLNGIYSIIVYCFYDISNLKALSIISVISMVSLIINVCFILVSIVRYKEIKQSNFK